MENTALDTNDMQSAQTQSQMPTETQKMLSQDEVNRIVSREKARAADAARREAEERYQREIEAANQKMQERRDEGVSRNVDADALYQQFREKMNQEQAMQRQQEIVNAAASSYLDKINAARQNYDDFDDTIKSFDPAQFPQIVFLLADIPNGGDVLYELQKNPEKLGIVDNLALKSPDHAKAVLSKISASIQQNKDALQNSAYQNVSSPLDRLSQTRVAGDNGQRTISDLRKMPWARG